MSKSRKNKGKAYGEKQKKKNNINVNMEQPQKQLVRKAAWSSEERFSISGDEFQALSNFANLVAPLVEMSNRVLGQAELDDKLSFEYAYADGSEVEAPVIEAYEKERLEKLTKKREEIEKYMTLLREQTEKVTREMAKIKEEIPDSQPA
jgi:hypothetical protein